MTTDRNVRKLCAPENDHRLNVTMFIGTSLNLQFRRVVRMLLIPSLIMVLMKFDYSTQEKPQLWLLLPDPNTYYFPSSISSSESLNISWGNLVELEILPLCHRGFCRLFSLRVCVCVSLLLLLTLGLFYSSKSFNNLTEATSLNLSCGGNINCTYNY